MKKSLNINMLIFRAVALSALFLTLFIFVGNFTTGCSSVKSTKYKSPEDGTASVSQKDVFPHKDGWGDYTSHGKFVIDNGDSVCANTCHGANFEGGSARGCKTCHPVYPHDASETWQGLLGHGKYAIDKGADKVCTTVCHGEDLNGGYDPQSKKSCTKCHTSYPASHGISDWSTKGHGSFVAKAGNSFECATMCHRNDVPKSFKLKGCADCHKSYPDIHKSEGWKGEGHGEFVTSYGGITSSDCTLCHGANLLGGTSGISCANSNCHHSGLDKGQTWGENHGDVAKTTLSKCQICHGVDLKGNSVVYGCSKCHHENWEETHLGKKWSEASQHGVAFKNDDNACKLCHGMDLKGGIAKVSCYGSCHGDVYPHTQDWASSSVHGPTAKIKFDNCLECHSKESGDCKKCHHDNVDGWANLHKQASDEYFLACSICHGEDPNSAGPLANNCAGCHGKGMTPHSPAMISGTCDGEEGSEPCFIDTPYSDPVVHGVEAKADLTKCKACHGVNLQGGVTQKSCYECHDSKNVYPHANDWKTPSVHGASYVSNGVSSCFGTCHGSKTDGGISSISCYPCHNKNPHGNDILATHGALVLTAGDDFDTIKFDNTCKVCHGPTYPLTDNVPAVSQTTVSGSGVKTCYNCHPNYPHRYYGFSNWDDNDAAHYSFLLGNKAYKGLTGDQQKAILNSQSGCVFNNVCHANSRKGPEMNWPGEQYTYCNFCH